MIDQLRQFANFAGLADDALSWLAEHAVEVQLAAGDVVFAEGAPATSFYVVLEGELQITKLVGGEELIIATHPPGNFTGEMPLLIGTPYFATARAVRPSRVLRVAADDFDALLTTCAPIRRLIFATVGQRFQYLEAQLRQREKLASLGTLSAGLAHELNNPAAAGRRATQDLRKAFTKLQHLTTKLNQRLAAEEWACLIEVQQTAVARMAGMIALSSLEQSDREDALTDWLDRRGYDDGWELAPTFVRAGIDGDQLAALAEHLPAHALDDALRWLDAGLTVSGLLDEVERSTARISELVHT